MFGLFIECIFYLIQTVFLFCCQENKPCACSVKKQRFHSQLCKCVALANSFNQFWRRFSSREKCDSFILWTIWTGNGRRGEKKVDSSISLTLNFQKICWNEWYTDILLSTVWRQSVCDDSKSNDAETPQTFCQRTAPRLDQFSAREHLFAWSRIFCDFSSTVSLSTNTPAQDMSSTSGHQRLLKVVRFMS